MKQVFNLTILLCFMVMLTVCEEDDKHDCERYCDGLGSCYKSLNQPFSKSACKRDCFDDLEANESVGCKGQFLELLECRSDVSCTDANDLTEQCSTEIDNLAGCLD